MQLLDGGGAGPRAMLLELNNQHIGRSDQANIAHSLQAPGQLTTKAASETDVNEEIGRKLRSWREAPERRLSTNVVIGN
jgi:hypothetical protein